MRHIVNQRQPIIHGILGTTYGDQPFTFYLAILMKYYFGAFNENCFKCSDKPGKLVL